MKTVKAYHGGSFFNAIGNNFSDLERARDIISADVLDAWFDPSPRVLAKIQKHLAFTIRTSPPTQCDGLVETIANVRDVSKECIAVAGGSSDVMFNLFPRIVNEESHVLLLDPMYGEYAHIFEHVTVPKRLHRHLLRKEEGFKINAQFLAQDIAEKRPSLVVLVNPNSPTGLFWKSEQIILLCEQSPDTLFVVDETYIEYVRAAQSIEKHAVRLKNLIVIKSMSKVYALSGARVGYMVSSAERMTLLQPFFPPWSVSLIGQIAGVEALQDPEYYAQCYNTTHTERENMRTKLQTIPNIAVYNGVANFLLVELLGNVRASALVQQLQQQNVFIRNCDSTSVQFTDNFVRIAVKSAEENDRIVQAMRDALC